MESALMEDPGPKFPGAALPPETLPKKELNFFG
jgi:predicted urease superfamily metal-dependent hydrolase